MCHLYSLPLIINDISVLVSNGTNCLNSIHFEFWSPQLHQRLHPHSTCHLNSKTYPQHRICTSTNIYTCATYTGYCINSMTYMTYNVFGGTLNPAQSNTVLKQSRQINDFITFGHATFIPLHFLCNHCWQLVHCIVLLPTLPQTPHGHLANFCIRFWRSPFIITLVFTAWCFASMVLAVIMCPSIRHTLVLYQNG